MPVYFDDLQIGYEYDRPFLARHWGYKGFQGLSRGVVTPSNTHLIILFVTKNKQSSLQQYNDYIDDSLLFWDGEDKHGSDQRILYAKDSGDEIHLFYRENHHTPFIYLGQTYLLNYIENKTNPSRFIFQIGDTPPEPDIVDDILFAQSFKDLSVTERLAVEKSRIGQGIFRDRIISLWGSCSVTSLTNLTLVRASHIKPWRESNNSERLNPYNGLLLMPNFDLLFDKGFIGFKDNGQMIISTKLTTTEQQILQISGRERLRKVFPENKQFLEFHRDKVLQL